MLTRQVPHRVVRDGRAVARGRGLYLEPRQPLLGRGGARRDPRGGALAAAPASWELAAVANGSMSTSFERFGIEEGSSDPVQTSPSIESEGSDPLSKEDGQQVGQQAAGSFDEAHSAASGRAGADTEL